jgi:Repeat of unknown function (DUF5648)
LTKSRSDAAFLPFNFAEKRFIMKQLSLILFSAVFVLPAHAHTNDLGWLVESASSEAPPHHYPWLAKKDLVKNSAYPVLSTQTTPRVLTLGDNSPVRFEAFMNAGQFTGVPSVVIGDKTYPLNDSGSNGDLQAGDGIWSVFIPATEFTAGLQSSDVYRRDYGKLEVSTAAGLNRFNLTADIVTPEIPTVAIKTLSANAQQSRHVLNIASPNTLQNIRNAKETIGIAAIPEAVSQAFQYLKDEYDYLVLSYDRQHIDNRVYLRVNNSIQGIGLANNLHNTEYSSTRLAGVISIPNASVLDHANHGFNHEIGHTWINQLKSPADVFAGAPHWPPSTLANHVMGFSIPGSGAGGRFACLGTINGNSITLSRDQVQGGYTFNDLDLYLMGLLPAAEVKEHATYQSAAMQACTPGTYSSGFTKLSIAQVVAGNGLRLPSAVATPKQFKLATVIISSSLLSPQAMAFYDYFSRRASGRQALTVHEGLVSGTQLPFYLATGGRATLDPVINPDLPEATITITEFYNAALNRYFYTADPAETNYLKTTPASGETATGESFKAYAINEFFNEAVDVCRFYGSIKPGPNSHFYTADADECNALKALQASTTSSQKRWNFEAMAYKIKVPVAGQCPVGSKPVYRLFNRANETGKDSNHRLTINPNVYQAMQSQGWKAEGVVMCAGG